MVVTADRRYRWLPLWGDRLPWWSGYAITTRVSIRRHRWRISTLTLFFLNFFELFNFFVFSWLYETKKTCFWVTTHSDNYVHVQMWVHGDQRASHVTDGGEEETTSLVWMWSERSRTFIPTLCDWLTGFLWRKSKTCQRLCSDRWWVCHAHGCDCSGG